MAGIHLIVCDREKGCKVQFGSGDDFDIDGYVKKQAYMENETEVRKKCSQVCSILEVVIDTIDIAVDDTIITGVRVSGTTRDGTELDEAPGVVIKKPDGDYVTRRI